MQTQFLLVKSLSYLFITPPFTQLNTSYPAISYLTGFMRRQGISAEQADLSIDTFLSIFSRNGIYQMATALESYTHITEPIAQAFLGRKQEYINKIDAVVRFLQGKDATLADRIVARNFLPEGSRFLQAEDLDWAFGTVGIANHAKYLCTLFLEDIGDVISKTIDPDFAFSRYAETIAREAHSFDEIDESLNLGYSFTADVCIDRLQEYIDKYQPNVLCISVPFPGNLLMGLQCAKYVKENYPRITTIIGGGFVNTELRNLSDPAIFKYIDYITLDDGERPLLQLHNYLLGLISSKELVRTYRISNGKVEYTNNDLPDFDHSMTGWPDYEGLNLDNYLSFIEVANPMHRLWSDGRWNKMTLTHGCYWHKCSFCDTELDYIKRYSQTDASVLCDRVEKIIEQTASSGFHFTDEAVPPAVLRDFALEIIRRNICISWWTNIRFERAYTADLCRLLAASGCIAVTGGLEVASDRVLELINKNISVEQATKTAYHFASNGIMVHAYLMYGFPTQTEQETIDSLEVVRQLMEKGLIQSAFWHKFTVTAHSPIGTNPKLFKIEIPKKQINSFANNDLDHIDKTGSDPDKYGDGLKKALYNYLHGICFDTPVHKWFNKNTKQTTISPFLIDNYITEAEQVLMPPANKNLYFINQLPTFKTLTDKNGKKKYKITAYTEEGEESANVPEPVGWWLENTLPKLLLDNPKMKMASFENAYEDAGLVNFQQFLYSPIFDLLCKAGLIIV